MDGEQIFTLLTELGSEQGEAGRLLSRRDHFQCWLVQKQWQDEKRQRQWRGPAILSLVADAKTPKRVSSQRGILNDFEFR